LSQSQDFIAKNGIKPKVSDDQPMHMPYPSFGQNERKRSRANSNYRIEISDQPEVIEIDPIPVNEAAPGKLGESITFHPSEKETKGNESPDNSSGS
jgi:hypothetical protein